MEKNLRGGIKLRISGKVLLTVVILTFVVSFSSCKKDDFTQYNAPVSVFPLDKGILGTATSTDLKWTVNPGTAGKWNVYFGEKPAPDLFKADYNSQALNVPVAAGHTYYWKIGTFDKNGAEMFSPVYSFKVKVLLDIDKFTGVFDCNEPKYGHYEVKITRVGKDTIQVDNFWDLKWQLKYVFDDFGKVQIVPKTFTPDRALTCTVSGAGTFDYETNEFRINYTVLENVLGNPVVSTEIDDNTHFYTKK